MLTKLEYGVPTDKCALQLRLGAELGFFREEGIDLDLRVVFGGPEIAEKYHSGEIKIGEMGTPPCLTAISKGMNFKIIGSSVRRDAVQFLVINDGHDDWPDLVGNKLGVLSIGSCSYWFMRSILMKHNLDPDNDVSIVGLGEDYPDVVRLLSQGEVDGAMISEPNVSMAEADGGAAVWLSIADVEGVPQVQWSVCVANERFLNEEPDLISAFFRAARKSYHYAADNKNEWAKYGATYFSIPYEVMRRSIEREIGNLHFDLKLNVVGLSNAIDLQKELHALARDIKFDDVVDLRFQPTT